MRVAVAIVIAVTIAVTATLLLVSKSDPPMKMIAVCTGEGTQSVKCTWIPADESERTAAEQELFKEQH